MSWLTNRGRDTAETENTLPDIFKPEPGMSDAPVDAPDMVPGDAPGVESAGALQSAGTAAAGGNTGTSRVSGWRRVFRGNRALWITVAVAVVCLAGGIGMGRFILSPADAAEQAQAPPAGYITVPVEYGELSNDVTLRGQVGYADSTEVKLNPTDAEAAVVTGHVPEVDDELKAGSIALEIAGRPVFVLPGELPAYRTLRYGSSGPDVAQLKEALNKLGHKVGKGNKFDKNVAEGIRAMYEDAGYTVPTDPEAREAVRSAEAEERAARQAVSEAKAALKKAKTGLGKAARREQNNQVADAKNAVKVAKVALQQAKKSKDALEIAEAERALKAAQGDYELRKLERKEAKSVDTSAEKAAVTSAEKDLADAKKQLKNAKNSALPYLSASEVLYLTHLPRRVDSVEVERGSLIDGPVMSVSGATIELSGSAADADAKLLEVGGEAFFELPDETEHRAVIAKIEADSEGGRATITFTPDPLKTEQIEELQGTNVRVRVPVGATEGEVLSVPFAALTAGPGGESRVEVVEGDPREGERAATRLVVVKTGLAAGGYVEVSPVEGTLNAGDLVAVGA